MQEEEEEWNESELWRQVLKMQTSQLHCVREHESDTEMRELIQSDTIHKPKGKAVEGHSTADASEEKKDEDEKETSWKAK